MYDVLNMLQLQTTEMILDSVSVEEQSVNRTARRKNKKKKGKKK